MSTDQVITIYPSDIEAARDAAIKIAPKDVKGYSAFRINLESKKQNKVGNTTYIPFEVNLGERGWQKVIIKIVNNKHVGKINDLEARIKGGVQDCAVLFKGTDTYERTKTDPKTGAKIKIIENYGAVKEYICDTFMAHVRKYQAKGQFFSQTAKVIPNVKRTKEVKNPKTGEIKIEPIVPANINVGISFVDGTSTEAKKIRTTKFKTVILDATKEKKTVKPGEFPFEAATVEIKIKGDDGSVASIFEPINNGNIHQFLRGGSLITGFDDMSDVCISQGGISLPSKLSVAIVRQATMARVNANNFNDDDYASIKGATAVVEEPATEALVVGKDDDGDFATARTGTANAAEFDGDDFTPDAPTEDLDF